MSSFFTNSSSNKKRKRSEVNGTASESSTKLRNSSSNRPNGPNKAPRKAQEEDDESISGSDSDISTIDRSDDEQLEDSSSEDEGETAAERRLRLAERYIDNLRQELAQDGEEDPAGFDAVDVDRDLISARLREDVAESKGKVYRYIASQLDFGSAWKDQTSFRADQLGLTAIATVPPFAYTVGKDKTICKWEIPKGTENDADKPATNITAPRKPQIRKKYTCQPHCKDIKRHPGHVGQILCIAASPNGKFLATGGADNRLVIWDALTLTPLKAFSNQHRDSILGLSFRRHNASKGPQTLYTASADRSVKVWSIEGDESDTSQMTYTETLFGHEDRIVGVVGLAGDKCISVGARDRSARLWKVVEESQLVYRGGGMARRQTEDGDSIAFAEGSIDCVAMLDEENFVTGSDNGSISLWSVLRKKPIFTLALAHGADSPPTIEQSYGPDETIDHERQGSPKARWITALATVPYSDLIFSGSWDGTIRAWKVSEDKRRIEPAGVLGGSSGLVKFDEEPVNGNGVNGHHEQIRPLRGVVNGIGLYDRGDRGKDGLCVVAVVSKTHRLGRYTPYKKARDEGVLFNVDRIR
jgi:ribosomal RNA-processing protein 9